MARNVNISRYDERDDMRSLTRKLNRDFSVIKSEFIGNLADDKRSDGRINIVEKAEGALEELVVKSLSGDNASFNTVIAGVISADFAHITDGVIDNATIDHASVNGLSANYAEIENGVIKNANIDQAQVRNLSTYYAHITNGKIDNATIDVADVNDLNANYAHITNGTIDNATIDVADVNDLSANYAHITNGVIDNAKIKVADVNELNANYATINLANVNNAWIENGVIKNAAISDAQIIGMSANKLTAGTIDASKIYVTNLNADNITVGTINGQRIGNSSIDLSKLAEEVPTKEYLDSVQQNLQGQIDGQIETWTSSEIPLLSNYPASSWTDQKTRKAHVGDILYVVNAASDADGYCYRFSEDSSGAFSWVLIKDSDVTKALKELIDIQGDVHGLQSFKSETSSWITNTDEELSSLKTNQTTLETNLGKKVETSVFNQLSQTVSENSSSITSLSDAVDKKADGSTVATLSSTVNIVKQTADANSSTISSLTKTVSNNKTEIEKRASAIEQDLSGFKSTVSSEYETMDARISSAETAIEQNSDAIALRATKTEAQGYANSALSDAKSFTTSQGYLTVNSDKITAMVRATTAAQTSADDALELAGTKIDESAAINITKNQIKNIVISPSGGTTATQSPDGFTWTISSPTVPTKVSQLTNDSSFQTESQVSTAADNAAKTATDFMKFSAEEGLTIGDYISGELSGASTNIKPDGLRIYDQSSNELAHFLADEAKVANLFIDTNYASPEHQGYEGARIVAHNQDDYTSNRLLEIQSGFGLSQWATGIVLMNNIPSKEISKIEFKWCDGDTLQQKRAEIHDLFGYTTKTVEGVKWRIRKTPYMTEAWATITRTITGGMTNDGVWGYSVKADAVKYPTNLFSSTPKVMISSRGPFGYPMLVGNGTAASTPVMYFYRPTDYDNITVYFDLYVIGE